MNDKEQFRTIANCIAANVFNVEKIELDEFILNDFDYTFIVVTFTGGNIGVRNARMNSLAINIQELGKMLRGNCYSEVEDYKKLKELSNG